ncbi:RNA-guided endonuclease InsQ/TnpB family protein [Paenibacillus wynnii]|uniref:RNA-guided endonuclease InsQ/TnpB family protein n=1 Tax=Paenibacillus wynnii TaxID=268407 RepID=UPI002793BED1|nr:transposase [Paenibacillus wynnii]MDQ0195376.1 putative transposase [Paenibacillus wynnii]
MLLNYKYEIFLTIEQQEMLNLWLAWCRQTYNSALLDKSNPYKATKKSLSRQELQKMQVEDKKKYAFLKEMPSQPLQEVFFRLEKALEKFFKKEAKYPKIKSSKDYCSLTFTQFGMAKQYDKKYNKTRTVRRAASLGCKGLLQISGLGLISVNWHRKLDGKVKQCIIKRQGTRWYVIFSVEKRNVSNTELDVSKTTGIDVGIKKFAVLSNGEEIENPKFLRKSEKKLKRQQRRLSRRKKGSKNWKKQLVKVQKIHTKVANQRKDFLHKQSFNLARTYSVICVEDLKIKNMIKNRHLAKSIADAGWGMFRSFLNYKCEKNGGLLVKVKPHFTSQKCSNCGNMVKKSLSVRTHICSKCRTILDRDHNAAINIEKEGLKQVTPLAS